MASPATSNQPVITTLIRQKSKNGWTYVIERKSQYDDTLKRTVELSRHTVGKLPPGSTDIYDMVPIGQRGRPAKKPAEKTGSQTSAAKAQKDGRKTGKPDCTRPVSGNTGKAAAEQASSGLKVSEAPVIHRRVGTADPSQVTPALAKAVTDKGSDYCFCIEYNNRDLYTNIASLFDRFRDDNPLMCISNNTSENSSEQEEYTVRILPSTLLDKPILKQWAGLRPGCIVKEHQIIDDKISKNHIENIKYYITTLDYDYEYISEDLSDLIRYKMKGKEKPKVISISKQDIDDTIDDEEAFLRGVEKMKKLSSHVLDVFVKMESAKTNKKVSRRQMQAKITDIKTFLKYYMEALNNNLL